MIQMHAELFESGIAAREAAMPVETLRLWERCGLVAPTVITAGGQRLYDRETIEKIRELRQSRQAARAAGRDSDAA